MDVHAYIVFIVKIEISCTLDAWSNIDIIYVLWFLGKNTEIDLSINVHFVGQCDFESFFMHEVISINTIIQCIITISNLKTDALVSVYACVHDT